MRDVTAPRAANDDLALAGEQAKAKRASTKARGGARKAKSAAEAMRASSVE